MTNQQLTLIHAARRQLGLDEADYREILANIAGVKSSKDLTNKSFEDVMAHLEHRGFRHLGQPADYWRSKTFRRGIDADARQLHKIAELAAAVDNYDMAGLIRRVTKGRCGRPEDCNFKEANAVIEMLKSISRRQEQEAAADS